ncbi:GHKL domain-containing protein [Gilvimarinus agarilyticus]|uniref:ATP-binding protein n=1 Tax=unclassified Gilvimarinus TaxID=2642066 RepID=UPI001C0838F6|nr:MULTISPECIES: ATP-binding protein [unclassified Gilvimarinus]MBU2887624.1 GHKL domain-containing protein [Gilvimarinus agarilyticus]MDO6572275.1 ATP-binding protein [Gilvimarinus sp. 2_MG-2023]MDO6746842.1 ATP-binding protein [Gilvimarinus sp. 1_MG-2023]
MAQTTLKARLLVGSLIVLPLVLILAGLAQDRAYRSSLSAAEQVRLERYFYLLFSLAEMDGDSLNLPSVLIEPDLEQTNSGVYAFVYNAQGDLIWQSSSSRLIEPTPGAGVFGAQPSPGELVLSHLPTDAEDSFYASFDVLWETDRGVTNPYRFALVHSGESYYSALKAFRQQQWRGLLLATASVIFIQALLLVWALRPLSYLARALGQMHRGETAQLRGEYPGEIQEVVTRLNRVLQSESHLRQRYRDSLSDLAHSLKTPLAVLKSAPIPDGAGVYGRQVLEQIERMDQVVKYQLQRAANQHGSGTRSRILLTEAAERITASLKKIYRDKNINFTIDVPARLAFVGDEQDLLEILGNLLDNACKYGQGQVTLSAQLQQEQLQITVDDDGDGIAETLRDNSLERGQRLDTSKPGQGIGLAICADIAAGYHGQLKISRSPLGGARFTVKLPGSEVKD